MHGLPDLILLVDYDGDFPRYIEAVYRIYRRDFLVRPPELRGRACHTNKKVDTDGREIGFWHIVTEGNVEAERTPSIRRCERIAWPAAMIEAGGTSLVPMWTVEKKSGSSGRREARTYLSTPDFDYLVVLKETGKSYLLITAFYVEHESQRRKIRREWLENS